MRIISTIYDNVSEMRKLFLILFALVGVAASAQSDIVPAGGMATSEDGSLSFTLGQVFYSIIDGTDNSIVAGVQQPYVITEEDPTGIENIDVKMQLTAEVYPNPATDKIVLNIGDADAQLYSYTLIDGSGSVLANGKTEGQYTSISMSQYPSGYYFLRVSNGVVDVKVFKILKK